MKFKSIFQLFTLLFVALVFSNTANAQAYHVDGAWIIKGVEFSPEDEALFVDLMEQANPEASLINSFEGEDVTTYGNMSMESIQLVREQVGQQYPSVAGWVSCEKQSIINQCETKNVYHFAQAVEDRRVAAEINNLLSRYQAR